MNINALTYRANTYVNRLVTPVTIINPITKQEIKAKGIWDTGATNSAILDKTSKILDLCPLSIVEVIGVHGKKKVFLYNIIVRLNNENIEIPVHANECTALDETDSDICLLIGMDVITRGDLAITNFNNQTVLTFRYPSIETIDYVKEIEQFNNCLKKHNFNEIKHITDKCYCGSGKLFKNCHGLSKYNK